MGKTFVYNKGKPIPPKGGFELEFGMFFDGTLNNMYNTELREKYRDRTKHIRPKDDYIHKADGSKITDEEYKLMVEENESAIKAHRETDEALYDKLKNKDPSAGDSEYLRYIKSCHREPLKPFQGKFGMDELGVDNSFSNDYTNIARMFKCCDEQYAIYIEGIGTIGGKDENDKEKVGKDVDDGFQYGSGFAGVRGKVRRACEMLAQNIGNAKKGNNNKIPTQVIIDVSGFSRGAAAARNFVYEVNNSQGKRPKDIAVICETKRRVIGYRDSRSFGNDAPVPIYESYTICKDKDKQILEQAYLENGKMPKYGYLGYYLQSKGVLKLKDLDELTVILRFIGVYDTVSSYEEFGDMGAPKRAAVGAVHATLGAEHDFGNDVEQLQLNNLGRFAKAVHFTAKDEHRENFALTRFPGSKEYNLPGVHCDVGGAYETGTEVVDEIDTANVGLSLIIPTQVVLSNIQLSKRGKHLVSEHWYKDEELSITIEKHSLYTAGAYTKLTGTRFLKKEYSYIPLHFMEELGSIMKHKMIKGTYPTTSYPINDATLSRTKAHLKKYVDGKEREWVFIPDEELMRKQRERLEKEQFDKELREGKGKIVSMEADALKVYKRPQAPILVNLPKLPVNPEIPAEDDKIKTIDIEEVLIEYIEQDLLRALRHKYLHWSANRDWLGMDPAKNNKRVEH